MKVLVQRVFFEDYIFRSIILRESLCELLRIFLGWRDGDNGVKVMTGAGVFQPPVDI